jgi:hypothetical protein
MSRADLNARNKATATAPQKPGRTAARERDRLRKNLTPRVRRLLARRSLAIRSARAKASA